MRRLFRLAVVAAIVAALPWTLSRADEPTTERTNPNIPNVPASFQAFNVTGRYKGRFHSHIAEYGLEPMVMIFTRKTDFSAPVQTLLQEIDAAVAKNPTARLHAFVVVQSGDLPEAVGVGDNPAQLASDLKAPGLDDKQRADLEKKLDAVNAADDLRLKFDKTLSEAAGKLKLQHVDIDLAGKADLEKFKLEDAAFGFFLFQRGKVMASRVVSKEPTDADVQAIMALDVAPFGPQNTALIVTRDAALSDPLKDLLKKIDAAAEKNPAARLHAALVLLSDEPNRDEAAAKLEAAVKEQMLKQIEVVAAGASDLQGRTWMVKHVTTAATDQQPNDLKDVGFAFILVQRGAVKAGRLWKKDQPLAADATAEIMKMLAEKAGADKQ